MPTTGSGGFVRDRKLYRLVFDGESEGLAVTVRSTSIVVYRRIAALASRAFSSPPSEDDLAVVSDLYAAFAAVLVEWNLEEPAGVPVPASLGGVESQEPDFVLALIMAWLDAVATALGGVPPEDVVADFEASLSVDPLG